MSRKSISDLVQANKDGTLHWSADWATQAWRIAKLAAACVSVAMCPVTERVVGKAFGHKLQQYCVRL